MFKDSCISISWLVFFILIASCTQSHVAATGVPARKIIHTSASAEPLKGAGSEYNAAPISPQGSSEDQDLSNDGLFIVRSWLVQLNVYSSDTGFPVGYNIASFQGDILKYAQMKATTYPVPLTLQNGDAMAT